MLNTNDIIIQILSSVTKNEVNECLKLEYYSRYSFFLKFPGSIFASLQTADDSQ